MAPIRPHKKSRTGCRTCRDRRVKCDETRPRCFNCTKRGLACGYTVKGSSSSPERHVSCPGLFETPERSQSRPQSLSAFQQQHCAHHAGQNYSQLLALDLCCRRPSIVSSHKILPSNALHDANIYVNPNGSSSQVTLMDATSLELFAHFTRTTSLSLSSKQPAVHMDKSWQTMLPTLAIQHPPVMSLLLGLSATHLQLLHGPSIGASKYQLAATSYYHKAVNLVRTAMSERSSEKAQGLFVSSFLIAIFAMSNPEAAGCERPCALAWIALVRGIAAVLREYSVEIRQSELAPMLLKLWSEGDKWSENDKLQPPFDLTALPEWDRGDGETRDPETVRIYQEAVKAIEDSWRTFENSPQLRMSNAFVWPVAISKEFLGFLQERRPRALVILAHHCALLHRFDGEWWSHGRMPHDLEEIERSVGSTWCRWLKWPVSEIRGSKKPLET